MKLTARIGGVGLVGPGLAGWLASRDALAGGAPYLRAATVVPAPDALPPTERRRAGKCVRLAPAAGTEAARNAGRDPRDLATIFTSSTGDGDNLHAICEQLASDDRLISPTRFHNSVHNAPQGYWGIATGSMHAADSIAAHDASFGAGLLEAIGRLAADPTQPVLLIAYDAPYPEPLNSVRPIADGFAVALALSSMQEADGARITVEMRAGSASALGEPALESLRRSIPAARALPLLSLLARGGAGEAAIDYLDGLALHVSVQP
jgi:hypothetical protein